MRALIHELREASGAPSISCGVLHHGQIVFTHCEGYADVEERLEPDEHTIYPVASTTKAFITALCGILVDEGLLSWTEPISTYLPDFETVYDSEISKRATLLDLCSHGAGLAPLDQSSTGFFDELWNPGSANLKKSCNLPVAYDFRSRWVYNNYLLDVVGTVISKVCGKRSGLVMKERIFEPLGMTRSFTRNDEFEDKNSAKGYAVFNDASVLSFSPSALEDGSLQGASGYVRSTVNDMLIWANAVLEAEFLESLDPGSFASSARNPLRQMNYIRCAHRPVVLGEPGLENSYGLGWFRHMLPSKYLASIGPNFSLLPDPPMINKNGPPRLTIAHWGEFGGYLTALYTFPASKSAIVAMTNCNGARGDPTDLAVQALCQELFDMKPKVDFQHYARQAAKNSDLKWDRLLHDWTMNRTHNTAVPPLDDFIGRYINEGLEITITVSKIPEQNIGAGSNPELLTFIVNDLPRQRARLRHYHHDTWTFLPDSRDDATRKGMLSFLELPRLLLVFVRDRRGVVCSLEWDLQGGTCEGPAPNLAGKVSPICFVKENAYRLNYY